MDFMLNHALGALEGGVVCAVIGLITGPLVVVPCFDKKIKVAGETISSAQFGRELGACCGVAVGVLMGGAFGHEAIKMVWENTGSSQPIEEKYDFKRSAGGTTRLHLTQADPTAPVVAHIPKAMRLNLNKS